jgi:hypothetical protein
MLCDVHVLALLRFVCLPFVQLRYVATPLRNGVLSCYYKNFREHLGEHFRELTHVVFSFSLVKKARLVCNMG